MKANRKADLQRKLAMAPVPKPPAGLAERIKSDIPKDLRFDLEKDRERFSHSIGFSMRVAASILLVISTAYLAVNLVSRSKRAEAPASTIAAGSPARENAAPSVAAKDQVAQMTDSVLRHPPVVPRKPRLRKEEDAPIVPVIQMEPKLEAGAERQRRADAENSSAALRDAATITESLTVTSAPAAAAAAPPPPAVAKSTMRAAESAPYALGASAGAKNLVERFAPPASNPARGISVDAEATETPFNDGRVFVRVSIDSGASVRDVRADVLLGEDVADARWLAGSWRWAAALFDRQSTTSVAEVVVGTGADAVVAVVRVNYRVESGEETIEKTIRRSDVKTWASSSRRTKAAVLAAKAGDPSVRERLLAAAREAGLRDLAAEIENR